MLKKFLLILFFVWVGFFVINNVFPTAKQVPIEEAELETNSKDVNSALNKGLQGVASDQPQRTPAAISPAVSAIAVSNDPLISADLCSKVSFDDIPQKQKCLEKLMISTGIPDDEKISFFRQEIDTARCLGSQTPNDCVSYIMLCLRYLMSLDRSPGASWDNEIQRIADQSPNPEETKQALMKLRERGTSPTNELQ